MITTNYDWSVLFLIIPTCQKPLTVSYLIHRTEEDNKDKQTRVYRLQFVSNRARFQPKSVSTKLTLVISCPDTDTDQLPIIKHFQLCAHPANPK